MKKELSFLLSPTLGIIKVFSNNLSFFVDFRFCDFNYPFPFAFSGATYFPPKGKSQVPPAEPVVLD